MLYFFCSCQIIIVLCCSLEINQSSNLLDPFWDFEALFLFHWIGQRLNIKSFVIILAFSTKIMVILTFLSHQLKQGAILVFSLGTQDEVYRFSYQDGSKAVMCVKCQIKYCRIFQNLQPCPYFFKMAFLYSKMAISECRK